VATNLIAQDSARRPLEQLPMYRMRLLGTFDETTGQPLEGVDVVDVLNGVMARTTSTGTVSLAFLPDGGSLVRLRKVGYEMQTFMVSISRADTTPITIILKRVAELPLVSVAASRYRSASLRGFEERRLHAAAGEFVSDSVIRKEEGRQMGSFLRAHLPNAMVRDGRGGSVFLVRSFRCGAGENPAVYVDGALISPPVNLADYPLTILAGIEYYANAAMAPPQFNATTRSCGVLLLWTRED
jgi:hypothetical protein